MLKETFGKAYEEYIITVSRLLPKKTRARIRIGT